MKKRNLIIALTAAVAIGATACGGEKPAETTAAVTAVETTAAAETTEAAAEDTESDELSESELAELESAFDEMTYDTVDDLNKELGYAALTLPEYWGEPTMIALADEQAVILYDLSTSDDVISMIQLNTSTAVIEEIPDPDAEKSETEIDGVKISITKNAETKGATAFWSDDTLNYSMDALEITDDQFDQALTEAVGITKSLPGGKPAAN